MNYGTEATYCPEDNKLRLYCGRVPREEYEALRSLGFKSTPKQDCDFVATWSVCAEDKVLSMLEDGDTIGDEDQSPADRAADRAERFAGYLAKRTGEALGHADTYESGPAAHGFQSQARADRAASKHDRQRVKAYSQWDKAEYWQTRTAGVIDNALYLTSASVRRGRIVRLETELRRYTQPGGRWHTHLLRRLEYERAMLESQGGSATDVEIVPGGYFGSYQVIRVHKSNATKQPVSVSVYHRGGTFNPDDHDKPLAFERLNIQRLGENAYTPPTPEDLERLADVLAIEKASKQKHNASKPKLINPTDEDAQRLQNTLNKAEENAAKRRGGYYADNLPEPTKVIRMTQAEYSARSKGTYTPYNAEYLRNDGSTNKSIHGYHYETGLSNICKVRIGPSGIQWYKARAVIVITDKPQKPLPAWSAPVEAVTA
tara:strand:- start:412785 stop:414074 length:1290 start_codon:yes stop_codon:yes gene_type:complete